MVFGLKARSKRLELASCSVSGANGNVEEYGHGDAQGDGDAQGYVEEQGEDHGDGDAQGYVEEQDEALEHSKDQAILVFEYEGRLMGVRISTKKQTI